MMTTNPKGDVTVALSILSAVSGFKEVRKSVLENVNIL